MMFFIILVRIQHTFGITTAPPHTHDHFSMNSHLNIISVTHEIPFLENNFLHMKREAIVSVICLSEMIETFTVKNTVSSSAHILYHLFSPSHT